MTLNINNLTYNNEFYYKNGFLQPAFFYVWGIINCTPNSFFDGGLYETGHKAFNHAKKLINDGADILDFGGASTRPGAEDIDSELEWKRISDPLKQTIAHLKTLNRTNLDFSNLSDVNLPMNKFVHKYKKQDFTLSNNSPTSPPITSPTILPIISIDTWRADVAKNSLEAGAHIINDVSAFEWEPKLLDIIIDYKPGYVLMHSKGKSKDMQKNIHYNDIVDEVYGFLEEKMNVLTKKGLPEKNIILDLGIGFGKKFEHNLLLLQHIDKFKQLNRPLLLGISNKSFFADLFGLEKNDRSCISSVCSALMLEHGIQHHRVHDVKNTRQSLILQNILQKK